MYLDLCVNESRFERLTMGQLLFEKHSMQKRKRTPAQVDPEWQALKSLEGLPQEELLYTKRLFTTAGEGWRVLDPDLHKELLLMFWSVWKRTPSLHQPFPSCYPCSLMRDDFVLLKHRPYLVTPKTDGTRYLLLLTTWKQQSIILMMDRALSIYMLHPQVLREPVLATRGGTLLDGELVLERTGAWTYYAFDCLQVSFLPYVQEFFTNFAAGRRYFSGGARWAEPVGALRGSSGERRAHLHPV